MTPTPPPQFIAPSAPFRVSSVALKRGSTSPQRLVSLDVFRGITIAAMLLVNDPGSWGAIYPPLRHAEWNGWTPTDLIFPFFLFIVGITTYLSLNSRRAKGADDWAIGRQVLKRGAIIILLGLAFSAFPYYPLTRITNMRIPGVLQRIGVTYICGAFLTMRTTVKQQVAIIAAILFGYWLIMTVVPIPGGGIGALSLNTPSATMAAWVDRWLLNGHLWNQTVTWDPEGVLSTIPAIATVMLGVLAGKWLFDQHRRTTLTERLNALFACGAMGMVLGLMWNWSFPINKNLWTSSYVAFTAGAACVTLATCIWLIDVQRVMWWTKPFVIFGTNAIVAYVGSEVFARLIYSVITVPFHGKSVPLQTAIYETAFASWLSPHNASLLFAVCVVLGWFGVLTFLYRKQLFFKV